MYRYNVDNAVTYTSEDFVLFRESPFACWMERLTLENPEHGVPADAGSLPPVDSTERQDDMADTLRAEGKDVRLIDWDADEPGRRSATLDAMRRGVDFIVNGQLALGSLSGTANLLVRTSGYSELGDFLYLPCETQSTSTLHSAFRLCFLADLLHSLQGQLPPQMLIIRGGDDLVPLQTDSHIYHYRAVKQRFMEAMRNFRKHRMPDPAASVHFGRWSDCAHEVLKQRLLREDHPAGIGGSDTEPYAEPLRRAVGAIDTGAGSYDLDDVVAPEADRVEPIVVETRDSLGAPADFTLAEQARRLQPGAYKAGPGVYRIGRPRPAPAPALAPVRAVAGTDSSVPPLSLRDTPQPPLAPAPAPELAVEPMARPQYNRRASDAALQNLEFIRSATPPHDAGRDTTPALAPQATMAAPAPSLRDPRARKPDPDNFAALAAPDPELPRLASWSAVDMDDTHLVSPPPGLTTSSMDLAVDIGFDVEDIRHGFGQAATEAQAAPPRHPFSNGSFRDGPVAGEEPGRGHFSDSLMTSDHYEP
ncbi:MAG: hypothetical protein KA159_09630 [Halioglobus sp.]|nr:hypothetical protein [Halioglobus sp.]MBP6723291.1 hypothetical protein [Halioglobus sp.]